MTAPERIWAFYAPEIADDEAGATIVAHENVQYGAKEYVRADLHQAEVAAALEQGMRKAAAIAKWVARDACDTPDELRGAAMVEYAILDAFLKGELK